MRVLSSTMVHLVITINCCILVSEKSIKKNANMASLFSILCTASIVVFLAVKFAAAREFKMGGDLGWHEHAPTSLHFIIIGMQGTGSKLVTLWLRVRLVTSLIYLLYGNTTFLSHLLRYNLYIIFFLLNRK